MAYARLQAVGDFSPLYAAVPIPGARSFRANCSETKNGGLSMRTRQLSVFSLVAAFALSIGANALAAPVKAQHHHDGKSLASDKLKTDGHHDLEHKGKFTTSVEVKGGKIAALHVKHSEKGDIPVRKYKTHKKMAQNGAAHLMYASLRIAQLQDMGTEYIGYSYVDDEGNEEIYWFPVEEVYDGDTGAVEYVPLSS
jgi:hypothetical protein